MDSRAAYLVDVGGSGMNVFLLTPYHIAREVYLVAKGYKRGKYWDDQKIVPLKVHDVGDRVFYKGRIKNKRFLLPANMEHLTLSLDDYSRLYVVPMLLEKRIIEVQPKKVT